MRRPKTWSGRPSPRREAAGHDPGGARVFVSKAGSLLRGSRVADLIADLLRSAKTIAFVGMSGNPEKDAHTVPKFMLEQGYRVVPVNPTATEILGLKVYKAITEVPEQVDIVDVFRPGPECDKVAEAAVKIRPRAVWLQLGITNARAKEIVESSGIQFIEDKCLRIEYKRVFDWAK